MIPAMPRALALLSLVWLFLLALSSAARAERFAGELALREGRLVLRQGDTSREVRGPARASLEPLAGRRVELEGQALQGAVDVDRVVSPERAQLELTVRLDDQGRPQVTLDGQRRKLSGRTELLVGGARATYDLWRLPEGELCVLARAAETQRELQLLRGLPSPLTWYVGWIRGKRRSVWITAASGNYLYARFGDREGWLHQDELSAPVRIGLSGALEAQPKD